MDCENLTEPWPSLRLVSTGLFIAVPYVSCHSFQHNDKEADCSSVPSTIPPASQKPSGKRESNIEFAEELKYRHIQLPKSNLMTFGEMWDVKEAIHLL